MTRDVRRVGDRVGEVVDRAFRGSGYPIGLRGPGGGGRLLPDPALVTPGAIPRNRSQPRPHSYSPGSRAHLGDPLPRITPSPPVPAKVCRAPPKRFSDGAFPAYLCGLQGVGKGRKSGMKSTIPTVAPFRLRCGSIPAFVPAPFWPRKRALTPQPSEPPRPPRHPLRFQVVILST